MIHNKNNIDCIHLFDLCIIKYLHCWANPEFNFIIRIPLFKRIFAFSQKKNIKWSSINFPTQLLYLFASLIRPGGWPWPKAYHRDGPSVGGNNDYVNECRKGRSFILQLCLTKEYWIWEDDRRWRKAHKILLKAHKFSTNYSPGQQDKNRW